MLLYLVFRRSWEFQPHGLKIARDKMPKHDDDDARSCFFQYQNRVLLEYDNKTKEREKRLEKKSRGRG